MEKYVNESWGFPNIYAESSGNQGAKKLMFLDSCIYNNIDNHLNEFSAFVSLEYSVIPIGMEYFKSNLLNIYLA